MPEMLRYCGERHRVAKTAHKACDTIAKACSRKYPDMVFLEGLRCSGTEHGGCQALCFIFWKEAWLERDQSKSVRGFKATIYGWLNRPRYAEYTNVCTRDALAKAVYKDGLRPESDDVRYTCQATNVVNAGEPITGPYIGQYFKDVLGGNERVTEVGKVFFLWLFRKSLRLPGYTAKIRFYNKVQKLRGSTPYPYAQGRVDGTTPTTETNLEPGDWVRIKPHNEILNTLNKRSRNRGLWFDAEQVPYCEKNFKVLRRVTRIINEETGKMMDMQNPCIILDNVYCKSRYSDRRYLCPRAIYSYWREIWLEKVPEPKNDALPD
jgi:hypothetical protein